jgi:predicted NodU family carbamoyl transferase
LVILGLSHPLSWSTGACILRDGKLIAMVEEERLNRVKFSPRMFPKLSIEFCLKKAGINLTQVDYVAIGLYGPFKCSIPNLLNGQPFLFSVAATVYLLIQNTYLLFKTIIFWLFQFLNLNHID